VSWLCDVFFSVIPTLFSDMALFVHFILQKSSLFSHPLLITPHPACASLNFMKRFSPESLSRDKKPG